MIVFLSISPPLFLVLGILATPPGPRIIPYYAISSDESTLSGFRVSKNTLSSDKARFGFSNSERTMSSSRRHYLRTSVRIFRQIQVYPGQRSVSTLRVRRTSTWTAELLAKIFLRRFAFQKVQTHYAYNVYFARFYGPIIFLFAFVTIVLSAMQVDLTINPPFDQNKPVGLRAFGIISRCFGVFQ